MINFASAVKAVKFDIVKGEAEREKRRKTLLSLGGSVSNKDGDELRRTAGVLRESWR